MSRLGAILRQQLLAGGAGHGKGWLVGSTQGWFLHGTHE